MQVVWRVCVCPCICVCVGMQELNRSYDAAKAQLATNDTFTQVYYNYSIRTHTHTHARMHAHTCTHTHSSHAHTHTLYLVPPCSAGEPGEEVATLGAKQLCLERVYPPLIVTVTVCVCACVCVYVCLFLLDCCPVIANRQAEGNYQQTAQEVKERLADYNALLCQTLTGPPSGLVN